MLEWLLERLRGPEEEALDPIEDLEAHLEDRSLGDLRILPELIATASDGEPNLRQVAMSGLEGAFKELETLRERILTAAMQRLTDPDPEVRDRALSLLGSREPEALRYAAEALDREALCARLARGDAGPALVALLEEAGEVGLLRALVTDDPDTLTAAAIARGYEHLHTLPADQPWAWRAGIALAGRGVAEHAGIDGEILWADYEPLLLPAFGDPSLREEALSGLLSLLQVSAFAGATDISEAIDAEALLSSRLLEVLRAEDGEVVSILEARCPTAYVVGIWEQIERRLIGPQLPAGASEETLARLEASVGPLPPALLASLRRHDGSDWLHGGELLSAEEIRTCHARQCARAGPIEVSQEEHDPDIPAVSWHQDWLPIWARGDGDLQALDRKTGAVLYCAHDGPAFRARRAQGYGAWLHEVLDDLCDGAYTFEDGHPQLTRPVWPR